MADTPYDQDVIGPIAIRHLVEFGDPDPHMPGRFGYWYNYLDYDFSAGGRVLTARHYLDESKRAILLGEPVEDELTMQVLQFLLMRFDNLEWLGRDGYIPVPKVIMKEVRRRLDLHLARAGG
ncbi:hypothetical protein DMC47_26770 [Nostoc sp. 3335mG]|nr:hypothetical protein DMC47_26770 [Nostoc sp. 3335mG]